MFVIPIENQHSYHSIPRNGDLCLSIDHHCNAPSRTLLVDWKGDCFVCPCEAWLPVSVGKITDFQQLSDVWNNKSALALQEDINTKKFTHCAVDRCGIINHSIYHDRYTISINIDESCNLACPSCRRESILITHGPDYDRKHTQVEHLVSLLENFDQPTHVVMSGNGDPLASAIMRPLIHRWQPKNNQTIRLFTNGLLLRKQLNTSAIVPHITQYFISIDAGTADVYQQVRGGSWSVLLDNLSWLKETVLKTRAEVLLKFVLQHDNWRDMENFCELCIAHGFAGVIHKLEDWGTWELFEAKDVIGNVNHTAHATALEELSRVREKYKNSILFGANLLTL